MAKEITIQAKDLDKVIINMDGKKIRLLPNFDSEWVYKTYVKSCFKKENPNEWFSIIYDI